MACTTAATAIPETMKVGETMLLHAMAAAGNYYGVHNIPCLTLITNQSVRVIPIDKLKTEFPPAASDKIADDMAQDMKEDSEKFLWFGNKYDGRINIFKVKLSDCEAATKIEIVEEKQEFSECEAATNIDAGDEDGDLPS